MDQPTSRPGLLDLPNEALLAISSYLDNSDLIQFRLVSKRLSPIAEKHVFRTVAASFVTLPTLLQIAASPFSQYVEELVFFEMDCHYTLDKLNRRPCEDPDRYWNVVNWIRAYYGLVQFNETPHPIEEAEWPPQSPLNWQETPEASPPLPWKANIGSHSIYRLLHETIIHYTNLLNFEESEEAFEMIKLCLRGLPNLKHIVIRDCKEGGILKSSSHLPPPLAELQRFFPLSQATFSMIFRKTPHTEFGHNGYLNILGALNALHKSIESLKVYPNPGLFHLGMPLINNIVEYHLGNPEPHCEMGLAQVNHFHASINVVGSNGRNYEHAQLTAENSMIHKSLQNSTYFLQTLSLSIDIDIPTDQTAFFNIIPQNRTFEKLHTLSLTGFAFSSPATLTNFLIRQRSLRHLNLSRCTIRNGRWHGVLHLLATAASFVLDSVSIHQPRDSDNEDHEANPRGSFIPSIVSNALILDFINSKDTVDGTNPFEKIQRLWRIEDNQEYKFMLEEAALSSQPAIPPDPEIEFEDASEWEQDDNEEWRLRELEDEDVDGPEFDTDYDFSAEEDSDSDDEGVIWGQHEWIPKPRKLLGKRLREDDEDMENKRPFSSQDHCVWVTAPDSNVTKLEFDAGRELYLRVGQGDTGLLSSAEMASMGCGSGSLAAREADDVRVTQETGIGKDHIYQVHILWNNGTTGTYEVKAGKKSMFVISRFNVGLRVVDEPGTTAKSNRSTEAAVESGDPADIANPVATNESSIAAEADQIQIADADSPGLTDQTCEHETCIPSETDHGNDESTNLPGIADLNTEHESRQTSGDVASTATPGNNVLTIRP